MTHDLDPGSPSAGAQRFRWRVYALSMLVAPVLLVPGTLLNPAVGGIGQGAANIAANAAADPVGNQVHIAIYVAATFLLPFGVLGMAALALPGSPWLATIGGGLGLVGWLPWAALAAQDDLTFRIAQAGGAPVSVGLWNGFTTDWAMASLTIVYVICHLLAFVVLGIALWRAGVVPPWASSALVLTSPLTIIAFAAREQRLLYVVLALWLAGSVPVAVSLWSRRVDHPVPGADRSGTGYAATGPST